MSANQFHGRTIYRYCDTANHAKALARGYVWLGTLQRCRQYENKQQGDPGEGLNYYHTSTVTSEDKDFQQLARASGFGIPPNAIRSRIRDNLIIEPVSMFNDAFVLCTSLRFDPRAFAAAWNAPHCGEITDAGRFLDLVIPRLSQHFRGDVEGKIRWDHLSGAWSHHPQMPSLSPKDMRGRRRFGWSTGSRD